jgi:hypothetical protein
VGNDDIASATDRFFFLSDITYGGNSFKWGKDMAVNYGGFKIGRYANPDIQWEISQKSNYGVEFNLLGFADMQIEYFTENRSKIYMQRQNLPASMGLTSAIYGNLGEVDSEGIDASVDIKHDFNKDTYITGRFNFTYAHASTVVASEPDYKEPWRSKVGYPVNQQWGLVAERLFIDEADVANAPKQSFGSTRPGDIKYKDINGDGKITADDRSMIGNPHPDVTGGVNIGLGWKNWDLSTYLYYSIGNDLYAHYELYTNWGQLANVFTYERVERAWHPVSNPNGTLPMFVRGDTHAETNESHTNYIQDGSYLRMQTLTLGYTLPKKWLNKIKMSRIRFYAQLSNVFTLTGYEGLDPEVYQGSDRSRGIDYGSYGMPRQYLFGVNIEF